MFITSREKAIIDLIVRTSKNHTVHTLASFLNVSVRTIQRDLKSVDKVLRQFELTLERTDHDRYFIKGKNEHIYRLMQHLTGVSPTDESPEKRKLSLLLILFHEGPTFKKQVLANQLGISSATLTTYMDDLAGWLSHSSIILTRKRGVGIELIGTEANKRHALASYFLVYFYEDLIESLYLMQKGDQIAEQVLGYFSPQYLAVVDQVVSQRLNKGQLKLIDSDYVGLIVHICIAIQRTENNFDLENKPQSDEERTYEHKLMEMICEKLQEKLSVEIIDSDIAFLTMILSGSKVGVEDVVYYDSILLSRMIQNVIQDVSSKLLVDLSDDFSLYQGLLAHMEPSIFRLKQKMDLFNPLTEEIKKKYPVLFIAVRQSLEKEFTDISFPDEEVAFIVLHFGSALLMNEENVRIKAVVVCPTGIGASKMLASRIKKELVEIAAIDILSIKDFQSANLNEYDIVISTIRLPFTDVDYILVSPLLSEKDIGFIRNYLQTNLESVTSKKQYLNPEKPQEAVTRRNQLNVNDLLQEIKDVHSSMDAILNNLRVYRLPDARDHWKVLRDMVGEAEEVGLVKNTDAVIKQLEERERKGGLGIPNTNMGLYHCSDESVQELLFQVAHLGQPSTIKGMDGEKIQMKTVLLMLAPKSMSSREKEILSIISTSLIESDATMIIYSSSNKAMIRKKLEDLFLDYLQNNLIKE
ncbi:BglG family transcription antiterminator [Desertibacillus haloalkaliphilus]|uniref:BglG family transcription antiterminator n=1 Tax=Desertibacillus haloalkaliphilus TaxID=1328930 RepID=UPI001C27CABD|nr:BglG family transcription antiterminator [Desertibacillus haloalkaliphilus]MBU8908580.1 BglG family transcription antiterminator [Desertibacillus haloalkaliphilus]